MFVGMAAATRDIVGNNAIPGHMKPLGEHKPMLKKIEVLDYVPSTQEFVDVHSKGRGFPFVMRGAAKTMPAWSKWTDAGLLANFKDATLDMVEKVFVQASTDAARPGQTSNLKPEKLEILPLQSSTLK